MINKINILKNNIKDKKIAILGSGISGQGAAILSNHLGANVLLSDIKKPKNIDSDISKKNITTEFNGHTKRILQSDLIILSPGICFESIDLYGEINKKGIPVVSEIEFASWFTKLNIVGVTGSNGKSTVVNIIYNLLLTKYPNSMLGGNIGISFSSNVLYEIKNNLENAIHVLEISSFQLEKIFTFNPFVACILNITKDHMDRYKNKKEYFKIKLNIIKNQSSKSYLVFNQDDPSLNDYCINVNNSIPFSILNKENKIFSDKKNIYCDDFNKVHLITNQDKTKLLGKHNLSNIIASITVSKIFKIKNSTIKKVLEKFNPLPHRMEKIKTSKDMIFINDSKSTNIYSTTSAIKSFTNNIILILGGCSKEKLEKTLLIDSINRKNITKVICYGSVGEKVSNIVKRIKPVCYCEIFKDAVLKSINSAKNNDVILLSPGFKSFDQFNNFEERGIEFKNIINQYIEQNEH